MGTGRPLPAPYQERINIFFHAFGFDKNAAIRLVADVAGDMLFTGNPQGVIPETYTLYPSPDGYFNAPHDKVYYIFKVDSLEYL